MKGGMTFQPSKGDARLLSLRIPRSFAQCAVVLLGSSTKYCGRGELSGVIPERAIEISTDLSGVVICPKSIIQNLNQLLDAVSNHGVIVGRYIKQAFSNPNEARFYVGYFCLVLC
jgi:hypothetical protein